LHTNIDNDLRFLKPDARWFSAPDECGSDFLPAFCAISRAVQIALREGLPPAYFQRLDDFQDRQRANAILLFQATPPFRARVSTDLTYDVLNPGMLGILARRAKPRLTQLLTAVEAKLHAAGQIELAKEYAPLRVQDILASVKRLARSRKCLFSLIRGEGVLVDALVQLAGAPELTGRRQRARMASFSRKWQVELRHICSGKDFSFLASAILDAATQALTSFQQK
jgi:hypothetical protein